MVSSIYQWTIPSKATKDENGTQIESLYELPLGCHAWQSYGLHLHEWQVYGLHFPFGLEESAAKIWSRKRQNYGRSDSVCPKMSLRDNYSLVIVLKN